MNQTDEIIADYTSANEELRLSMFLNHRDLRKQFTEIDMVEMMTRKKAVPKRVNGLERAQRHQSLTRNCLGWLKHCWSTR